VITDGRSLELEPLDQGEKPEFVHVLEGNVPPRFHVCGGVSSDNGVMETGGRGNVPGTTSQTACQKAVLVIGYMTNDHFGDLLGKVGAGWIRQGGPQRNIS
jgi:hypothetical protein